MARKKENIENSEAEIESAILNEFDEIGPGEIPEDVEKEDKKEEE